MRPVLSSPCDIPPPPLSPVDTGPLLLEPYSLHLQYLGLTSDLAVSGSNTSNRQSSPIFPQTLDTSFPLPICETPKPSTPSSSPLSAIPRLSAVLPGPLPPLASPSPSARASAATGVAASEEEGDEEVSSPTSSLTTCSSSCICNPFLSFAPIVEVQADPLLHFALAIHCVELKRKVSGVPFDSVIDTLISRFLYAFISADGDGGEGDAFISDFDPDIISSFRKAFEELSMEHPFQLTTIAAVSGIGGNRLPRVFADGRYLGGAEEVWQMHDTRDLWEALEGYEVLVGGKDASCQACGNVRFVPCETYSGSCKVYVEEVEVEEEEPDGEEDMDSGGLRRCPNYNENGLV
ncbi:hypothetical protein Taro_045417 [Colocasia esculenta]|uniref:Uncharacterized protein n=1 Tax=Colocasia esculenta TaxID=4460 RepID=A0A843X073_COLES|nr:hypothetical protein [Colocasia esculenta]